MGRGLCVGGQEAKTDNVFIFSFRSLLTTAEAYGPKRILTKPKQRRGLSVRLRLRSRDLGLSLVIGQDKEFRCVLVGKTWHEPKLATLGLDRGGGGQGAMARMRLRPRPRRRRTSKSRCRPIGIGQDKRSRCLLVGNP